MIKDGGKGSGIKGHTTPDDEIKKNINKVMDPKLRKTLESLLNHVNKGDKPQGSTGLGEKKTSEKLEEERADIHKYHPNIKNTSKLDRDIKKAKEMEKITKDCNGILRLSGFTVDEDPDERYKKFMAGKKKPLNYSEGKKLLEEAKKAGIHPDYLKGMERGLSSLSKDEEVSPKFKKVMEEYGKGELKSSSGEKVTDPKQAKAIAYSEAGETRDDLSQISKNWSKATIEHIIKNSHVFKPEVVEEAKRLAKERGLNVKDSDCGKVFTKGTEDGYKMEDPKEIEAAIKKVKESGHPNPQYLAGLEQALQRSKKERGIIKDDDATKGGAIREYGEKNSQKMEDGCSTKDYDDETMTTAEARQYWNRCHNSDPILKMYKSFEEWYRESKINGYIKDADPKVAEAEAIINLTGGIK